MANHIDELPSWTSAYGIGIGLERRAGGDGNTSTWASCSLHSTG